MRWLQSLLRSTWAAFVILAVCVGFLADFPTSRSKLEDSMSALLSVGVALLPYIAFGGILYSSGLIGTWTVKRILDWKNDGPSVRRFQSLAASIEKYNGELIVYLEMPPGFRTYRETSFASRLIMELRFVLEQLAGLRIPGPALGNIDIDEQGQPLVAYLAMMQTYAKNGELHRARQNNFWANWSEPDAP